MAIPAYVKYLGDTSSKTAGTTVAQVLQGGGSAAGNLIVARVIFDNAATASKPVVSSISKMAGETNNWVFLGAARSTSTSAGAFASGEMWCIQTTVAWSGTITVTLDTSVTQKAVLMEEFSGAVTTLRSTVGTAYSTTTTAASAATTGTAPQVNDLAIGLIFGSNAAAQQAGDTDTSGGSWSARAGLGSTGGNVATNNFGFGQYKVLTAATHQTFNNSAAMTAGNGSIVAVLQATPEPSITQAAYRFYADGTEAGSTALVAQDTAHTVDTSSGDVNMQLRVRLQAADAVAIPATDDWQLQYEKNNSGTWNAVAAPTAGSLIETYPVVNESGNGTLGGVTGGSQTSATSFLGTGSLGRVGFRLRKFGNPTGNLVARLYAHSGSYGSGVVSGTALVESTTVVPCSSLTTTMSWVYFDFDPYPLTDTAAYFIGVHISVTGISDSDVVMVGTDNTSPTYLGNYQSQNNAGSWSNVSGSDMIVEVYSATVNPDVQPYDSPSLTDGQATTSRLTGGTGSFVAGKVSEDGTADDVGWTGNNYTELLYPITVKASLIDGDTVKFWMLRNGGTTGLTFAQVPSLSISWGPQDRPATITSSWGGWTATADGTVVVNLSVTGERFFYDDAPPATATPVYLTNSVIGWVINADMLLQWRVNISNAAPTGQAQSFTVQRRINGWIGSPPWVSIGSSTAVRPGMSAQYVGATLVTTSRVTGGVGTFGNGQTVEGSEACSGNPPGNGYTELVWSIQLVASEMLPLMDPGEFNQIALRLIRSPYGTVVPGRTASIQVYEQVLATITSDWGGWTATANGTVSHLVSEIFASVATNFGTWTATADAAVRHPATIVTSWGVWTADAAATVSRRATVTSAWGNWTATANALRTAYASITTTWGQWTAIALATVQRPGTIASSWGTWTATATGVAGPTNVEVFAAIISNWGGWTTAAAATVRHPAVSASNWGTWTATANGIVIAEAITGTIASNWGTWTATGLATRITTGKVTENWGGWVATGTAVRRGYATSATSWGTWTATAAATVHHPATITTSWGTWAAVAVASLRHSATITTNWGTWTATALGTQAGQAVATISSDWGTWTAAGLATRGTTAKITDAWGGWVASGIASIKHSAVVTSDWGAWTATAVGKRTIYPTISTSWETWTAVAVGQRLGYAAITTTWGGWTAVADGVPFRPGAIEGQWEGQSFDAMMWGSEQVTEWMMVDS